MMLVVSLESKEPVIDQIVGGIRRAIAGGELRPGDELPPVRQLAADLGVNLNTVARAYRALEGAGLVSTARGRGRGSRVTSDCELVHESDDETRERIEGGFGDVAADAKLAGVSFEVARAAALRQLQRFYGTASGEGGNA